uniref:Uncharacterized protein n=2 Tax=Anas TaxID=8835 RepID=A0A493TRK9_ANAPP
KMRGCTAWWRVTPRCSVGPVSAHTCVSFTGVLSFGHTAAVRDTNLRPTALLCAGPSVLGSLEKQQWQQMKMDAMRTTKGRPISTTRQTVLKTPSLCLVRMSSKMELKKELIFCSMLPPG